MCVLAAVNAALAVGFFLQASWATALWPWTSQPLDYVVISSFLAAGAGAVLWIGLTGEWGALTGALIDVGLFNATTAAWLWARWAAERDSAVLVRAVVFTLGTAAEIALLRVSLRHPLRDKRPADRVLVTSFWVFAIVLLLAATGLLLQQPIWPWPLEPTSSTLLGLLFLGSATYFLHALRRPSWHAMKGQLVAFLLYDLVLIQPYLHIADGALSYHLNYASLGIYWAVIAYSSLLAAYYLFLNPATRGWSVQAG